MFTGVSQAHRIAREEIFGPVLSVLTFRTPAEAVEKANNTPFGLSAGVWTDKGSRILWMADQLRAGVVWANTFNKFDPTSPFGGYKESGYGREGGRHGLEGYLPMSPTIETRIDVRKTYKLYVGGAFPRSESGRSYVVNDSKGKFLANASHASRKDARDAVQAARKAFGGWSGAHAVQPRPGGLPDRRGARGPARAVRRRGAALRGHHQAAGRGRRGRRRSTGWSGTPGGPTRSPRSSAAPTRSPAPYFNFSLPEPTGVVGVVAPQGSSLLGLVSVVAPVIVTGNTVVVAIVARAAAARDHAVRGARHLRRARRRRQRAHRRGRRHGPDARLAHGRQRARPDRPGRRRRAPRRNLEIAAAENLKRVLPRPGDRARLDRRARASTG